jgi:hypothetical protein
VELAIQYDPTLADPKRRSRCEDLARTEIRRLWQRPMDRPGTYPVPSERVETLARTVLDTMLVRAFRVTPLPPEAEYQELLTRVTHWVRRGQPVQIMLGYGPMKNPRTTDHTHADWAEFFALCHLCAWYNKVCAVYPPGLTIKIIFDDSTIRMANRHPRKPMDEYIASVGKLIRELRYDSFIAGTMRQSSFAWLFHFGFYQLAGLRVRRWERNPANREAMDRMLEFSRRNLDVREGLSEAEREASCVRAAHRYRVYWEALQLSGVSRMGNKLIAMYLDGRQHHLPQPAALHLTSLGKGQLVQPWQGAGAFLDNGHGKLVPTVLTGKKLEHLNAENVSVSDVVPCRGFDFIQICFDENTGTTAA